MKKLFRLWAARRKLNKAERDQLAYLRRGKGKKLSEEEKEDEWNIFYQTEYMPLSDDIRAMESKQFLSRLHKYRIPYPNQWSLEGKNIGMKGWKGFDIYQQKATIN